MLQQAALQYNSSSIVIFSSFGENNNLRDVGVMREDATVYDAEEPSQIQCCTTYCTVVLHTVLLYYCNIKTWYSRTLRHLRAAVGCTSTGCILLLISGMMV